MVHESNILLTFLLYKMGYFLREVIQVAERVCNSKKLPDLAISLLTIDGNRPLTKLRVLYDDHKWLLILLSFMFWKQLNSST